MVIAFLGTALFFSFSNDRLNQKNLFIRKLKLYMEQLDGAECQSGFFSLVNLSSALTVKSWLC